jgi:hypothetical protein
MGGALTADLIATAIVASARAYGDDPVLALTVASGVRRRCLAPAIVALKAVTTASFKRVAPLVGCAPTAVSQARSCAGPNFTRAQKAAVAALAAHLAPAAPAPVVVVAPPAPPAPAGLTRPVPGAVSCSVRPALPERSAEPLLPTTSAEDQILEALIDGPHTTSGMASRLGLKEMVVIAVLGSLQREGAVTADRVPEAGRRAQYWRLAL